MGYRFIFVCFAELSNDLGGGEFFFKMKIENLISNFIREAELFGVGLAIPEAGGGGLGANVFGEFEKFRQLVDLGFKKVPDGLKIRGFIAKAGVVAQKFLTFVFCAQDERVLGFGGVENKDHPDPSHDVAEADEIGEFTLAGLGTGEIDED